MRLLMILAFVLVRWTTPAGAQDTGLRQSGGPLQISPVAGPPGTPLTVLGAGCTAGATLMVSFGNQMIGRTTADPSGGFETTVTTPATAHGGAATITVSGLGCQESAIFRTQEAVVQDDFARTKTRNLGRWEVAAGLAVLVAVLIVAIRRRRDGRVRAEG